MENRPLKKYLRYLLLCYLNDLIEEYEVLIKGFALKNRLDTESIFIFLHDEEVEKYLKDLINESPNRQTEILVQKLERFGLLAVKPEDIAAVFSLLKKAIISFIPYYTDDFKTIHLIVDELDELEESNEFFVREIYRNKVILNGIEY